jgi:hypothetical protein
MAATFRVKPEPYRTRLTGQLAIFFSIPQASAAAGNIYFIVLKQKNGGLTEPSCAVKKHHGVRSKPFVKLNGL